MTCKCGDRECPLTGGNEVNDNKELTERARAAYEHRRRDYGSASTRTQFISPHPSPPSNEKLQEKIKFWERATTPALAEGDK
jgi:hypothetical protein